MMASSAYLTYHDGKIEVPEDLQREWRLREGLRLKVLHPSEGRPSRSGSQTDIGSEADWRGLRGILAEASKSLNAQLEADRADEVQREQRWD